MWEQGWLLFAKGGVMMYPILISSVLAIAIGVERWFIYCKAAAGGTGIWPIVREYLSQGAVAKATDLCRNSDTAVAAVLTKGFEYYNKDKLYILRDVMEGAVAAQVALLRRRLSYLSTIVTIAPLLGLLGTVFGMIQTFNALAIVSGQPNAVTGGVGEALIATAAGLLVAIVSMLLHCFFTEWLESIISQMEAATNGIIESLGEDNT